MIHEAAKAGDSTELERLLQENPNLANARDLSNWLEETPLHQAARAGSVQCIQLLLQYGALVNARSKNGCAPIFEASTAEAAQALIDAGAQIDVIADRGRTALNCACQSLDASVVTVLVKHGADVNEVPDQSARSPLHWAFAERIGPKDDELLKRAEQVVRFLLEAGARVNAQDVKGDTPINLACFKGETLVRILLEHGANPNLPNKRKLTAFDAARNKPEILTILQPYRQEITTQPLTPEQLLESLLASGAVERSQIKPCTEEEIANLERKHKISLPSAYKSFLRMMGKGAGNCLLGKSLVAYYDDLMTRKDLGCNVKSDFKPKKGKLPPNAFVFASYEDQTCVYLYFIPDGSDDPPIWRLNDDSYEILESDTTFWNLLEIWVAEAEVHAKLGIR